jgi:hypothetical protein
VQSVGSTVLRDPGFPHPKLRRLFPHQATTAVEVGRAMIEVAIRGHPPPALETEDLNRVA